MTENPGEDPEYCLWTEIDEVPCINPLKKIHQFKAGKRWDCLNFMDRTCSNCLQFQQNSLLEEVLREIRLLRVTGAQG